MNGTMTQEPAERVLLTLLGVADPYGVIESFPKTEALDYSQLAAAEFERVLDALKSCGQVIELAREGRGARRFRVDALGRRPDAVRYMEQHRDRVTSLATLRQRLEPGRDGGTSILILDPKVIDIQGTDGKYEVSFFVPGVGKLLRCRYLKQYGRVYPPSRRAGEKWEAMAEWSTSFEAALRSAVIAHLGDGV